MKSMIGRNVLFHSNYGDGTTHTEAAIVVSERGERLNLVVFSAAGVMTNRHDVMQSREPCPGCWSPVEAEAQTQVKK